MADLSRNVAHRATASPRPPRGVTTDIGRRDYVEQPPAAVGAVSCGTPDDSRPRRGGALTRYRSLVNPEGPHVFGTEGELVVWLPVWPELNISDGALRTYYRFARAGILDGTPCPPFVELAEQWGTSPSTLSRRVNELLDAGLIDAARAPRRHRPGRPTPVHRRVHRIGSRDGYDCAYCGRDLACPCTLDPGCDPAVLDHVLPLSRGGPDTDDNLLLACWPCNSSKSDRTPSEWGHQPWGWRA